MTVSFSYLVNIGADEGRRLTSLRFVRRALSKIVAWQIDKARLSVSRSTTDINALATQELTLAYVSVK